jgi:hypothetical protein
MEIKTIPPDPKADGRTERFFVQYPDLSFINSFEVWGALATGHLGRNEVELFDYSGMNPLQYSEYDANWRAKSGKVIAYDQGEPVGVGFWCPYKWNGAVSSIAMLDGWPGIVKSFLADPDDHCRNLNSTIGLFICVRSDKRQAGLSSQILGAMKEESKKIGAKQMLIPSLPVRKYLYPLTHIDRYASWKRKDGEPFEPWLRIHCRLGARVLSTSRTHRGLRS